MYVLENPSPRTMEEQLHEHSSLFSSIFTKRIRLPEYLPVNVSFPPYSRGSIIF